MKVVLAGTRSFGLAVLQRLQKDHDVVGVISPLEDVTGVHADLDGIRWHHGQTPEPLDVWTRARDADLIVAAHSHAFLGQKTRAATRLGAIGYHPSLLPRHRGRDAVRWTVKMGDPIAGGSVYWLTDGVDTGPIAAQSWCHVDPAWTAGDLWRNQLFPIGVELLSRTLEDLERGVIISERQEERFATWEPSWGRPPLHRPELTAIGGVDGYQVVGKVVR